MLHLRYLICIEFKGFHGKSLCVYHQVKHDSNVNTFSLKSSLSPQSITSHLSKQISGITKGFTDIFKLRWLN